MMPDKERIIKECEWAIARIEDYGSTTMMSRSFFADVKKLLKEQEAKTGKWIEQTDYMGDTYYDCSVCNESWMTIEGTPWVNGMNYCPHCGAKMEGR